MSICFISPHLDDVVLSCSNKIIQLQNQGFEVIIITIFTGYVKGTSLNIFTDMATRKSEDIKAMEILGLKYYHLNFYDNIFEKKK